MKLDKTVHWDPAVRNDQEQMLNSIPADSKEFVAFMFRTSNVACHYYAQNEAIPTKDDYEDWLTGLPNQISDSFRKKGFDASKNALPLRRHAAERNNLSLDEFMRQSLSEDDYLRWALKMNDLVQQSTDDSSR